MIILICYLGFQHKRKFFTLSFNIIMFKGIQNEKYIVLCLIIGEKGNDSKYM
jgi:hypothetical protein